VPPGPLRGLVPKRAEKHCKGETQGIIPDILIGRDLYELKGIRSDASHSNYNGAQVTGVEKREKKIPIEIAKQAVRLDKEVLGIDEPTIGPWQRKLRELGGIKPLAFGQYGEMGPGLEALMAEIATAGADQAAEEYLLSNPEAAFGVQMRLLRQIFVTGIVRAQAQVILSRMHYALPGWEKAGERRAGQGQECAEQQRIAAARGQGTRRWKEH
jgi:hypothetical protein